MLYSLGDYCDVEPLDPIPNSPVKRISADCTWFFSPGD